MPNFTPIHNSHLRSLVIASETIMSLPEDEIQALIDGIAQMSPEGQQDLLEFLEQEQYEAQKRDRELEEYGDALDGIQRGLESTARAFQRENQEKSSQTSAEELLKKM